MGVGSLTSYPSPLTEKRSQWSQLTSQHPTCPSPSLFPQSPHSVLFLLLTGNLFPVLPLTHCLQPLSSGISPPVSSSSDSSCCLLVRTKQCLHSVAIPGCLPLCAVGATVLGTVAGTVELSVRLWEMLCPMVPVGC